MQVGAVWFGDEIGGSEAEAEKNFEQKLRPCVNSHSLIAEGVENQFIINIIHFQLIL